MNLHEMREFISNAYPGQKWKNRVKKMGENQIIAIYYSMIKRQNSLSQKDTHIKLDKTTVGKDESYTQLTIFDILKGE